ncbi:hypothetical protein DFH08DRAFT_814437 [Mycena albidolilacea]|uniref:Uncharacterized protein n=1 Tax=Mycena albidolilacea TaxID=1033008 RepID=A0AAD7EJV7_9AGAR|nr:hypothetical protein DFH08DRAFT_814437 [Mycena albidolilacea]
MDRIALSLVRRPPPVQVLIELLFLWPQKKKRPGARSFQGTWPLKQNKLPETPAWPSPESNGVAPLSNGREDIISVAEALQAQPGFAYRTREVSSSYHIVTATPLAVAKPKLLLPRDERGHSADESFAIDRVLWTRSKRNQALHIELETQSLLSPMSNAAKKDTNILLLWPSPESNGTRSKRNQVFYIALRTDARLNARSTQKLSGWDTKIITRYFIAQPRIRRGHSAWLYSRLKWRPGTRAVGRCNEKFEFSSEKKCYVRGLSVADALKTHRLHVAVEMQGGQVRERRFVECGSARKTGANGAEDIVGASCAAHDTAALTQLAVFRVGPGPKVRGLGRAWVGENLRPDPTIWLEAGSGRVWAQARGLAQTNLKIFLNIMIIHPRLAHQLLQQLSKSNSGLQNN